jgi:hypothetical protein
LADVTIFAAGSADSPHKREMLDSTITMAMNTRDTVLNTYEFDVSAKDAMYKFEMLNYRVNAKDNHEGDTKFDHEPATIRPFGKWYEAHFPGVDIKQASFFGIFAASRRHIHQKPKSFYKHLLNQVNTKKFHEASHYIERAWTTIFKNVKDSSLYEHPVHQQRIGVNTGGCRYLRR